MIYLFAALKMDDNMATSVFIESVVVALPFWLAYFLALEVLLALGVLRSFQTEFLRHVERTKPNQFRGDSRSHIVGDKDNVLTFVL